jgi:lipid II:glycine glycyltransferase (peptidoglycan interpeptide bridge formation enzyme)
MLRSKHECEQMNAVYEALDALQPTTKQLKTMYDEAIIQTTSTNKENNQHTELFIYQLIEHTRRRIKKENNHGHD